MPAGSVADGQLRVGDELVAVDGYSCEDTGLEEVKELLRVANQEVTFEVYRRNQKYDPDAGLSSIQLEPIPASAWADDPDIQPPVDPAEVRVARTKYGDLTFVHQGRTYNR